MFRRQARLRAEYIYRKTVEKKQRIEDEKRRRVRSAIEDNRPIPTELRKDAINLQKEAQWGGRLFCLLILRLSVARKN